MEVLGLKKIAEQAIALHQQGNLPEAERLYLQLLEADPALFGPRYYLGRMRLQQGRDAEACDYFSVALKVYPNDLGLVMNYGLALRAAGRPQDALEMVERALASRPNLPEALYNRGVALSDLERFEMAVDAYERALVLQPEMVAALLSRAAALAALGRVEDAIAGYGRALTLQPSIVIALIQRAIVYRGQRQPAQALADYDRALALKPDDVDALYNRGVVLMDMERAADALVMFERVMPTRQNDPEMLNNRGVALRNLMRPAEALASYEQALALEPGFAEVWGNRGLALRDLARYQEALASLDQVVRLSPGNAVALISRAIVLRDLKRYEESIEDYDQAIALRPDYAEALINRGYTKWTLKQYNAGLADVERALALEPDYRFAKGELLHMRMYTADWRDFTRRKTEVEDGARRGQRSVQPFIFQAVAESPADARDCSRIWARDKYPELGSARHDRAARKANKKLRIGYVSGEFRQQATAILMAGVYDRHTKEKFELVALDAGVSDQSPMRTRLEKAFDQWIDIRSMSDQDAAGASAAAGIDILVNLNGYFGDTRMGVFAQRPAPIQVNYLGFPATLGAPYMDYIIADKIVIPESEQSFYDEQVVYLPGCYQANDDHGREMAHTPSRGEAGVRRVFTPVVPTDLQLARLPLAGLFLDGLPYNAHTTGSDALWACVPLITRTGTTFAGRVATSLLEAVGLFVLVFLSATEFESLAEKLARDPAALATLRAKLAKNRETCALFDTAAFTRNLETAYETMWRGLLAGEKAKGFTAAGKAGATRTPPCMLGGVRRWRCINKAGWRRRKLSIAKFSLPTAALFPLINCWVCCGWFW